MKHAGGRPKGSTKYKPALAEKLEAYVDDCYKNHRIPWIEWFCFQNDVSRRTFYHWAKHNEDLDEARDRLMMIQELMLLNICVYAKGNSRGAIYLLIRNHGYRVPKPVKPVRETEVIFC